MVEEATKTTKEKQLSKNAKTQLGFVETKRLHAPQQEYFRIRAKSGFTIPNFIRMGNLPIWLWGWNQNLFPK